MTKSPYLGRAAFALAVLLLGVAGIASSVGAQGEVLARVQTFRGPVSVSRASQNMPISARNFGLLNGDKVATGPAGSARVVAVDGKRATMGPSSEIQIGTSKQGAQWRASAGRVAVWITGRGRTEVSTPGAVAAADGTGFDIQIAPDGTTVLTVIEGQVEWYNDQGRVMVALNQQSTAVPGKAPTRPVAVDASGIRVFEAGVENLALSLETPRIPGPRSRLAEREKGAREAIQAQGETASNLLALGDARYDQGAYPDALVAYERAQELQPNSALAASRVSLAALAEGKSDAARAAADRAAQVAPDAAEAAIAKGRILLAQGDAAGAEPLLAAAAKDPASSEGAMLLGVARLRQRKIAEGASTLQEALKREPDQYASHAYLSGALILSGDAAAAEREAKRAIELAPDSALAHESLGTVYVFSGRAKEAIPELRRSVEINPLAASARAQLARALASSDDVQAAEKEAALAVATDPGDAGARTTLGVLFAARRDPDRAEREFKLALQASPKLATARTGLAGVAIQRGSFATALKEQKAALDLDTGSPQAHNNLGVVYLAKGKLKEAITAFNDAISLQPNYSLPHANLAIAYLEENRYADALREGDKAVQMGQQSAMLRTTLARIHIKQRRYDRALSELRRAEVLDPYYPLQFFYLAQIYNLQGRDRDGVRSILRGLTLDPATAVEQRLYARTEFTNGFSGNEHSHEAKTDGRLDQGRLSYYVAGTYDEKDADRRNSNLRDAFIQGIVGYQPDGKNNIVLFSPHLDERGERPGKLSPNGQVEDNNFKRDFTADTYQLLSRSELAPDSHLTLSIGYKRSGSFADNPDDPGRDPQNFFLRKYSSTQRNITGEGQWERRLDRTSVLRTGISWTSSDRKFDGLFPDISGQSNFLRLSSGEEPTFFNGWAEVRKNLSDKWDVLLGMQGGGQSHAGAVIRPKVVAHYRYGKSSTAAFLAYPTFLTDQADLLPVETWAQPFEASRFSQLEGGALMNYELSLEHVFGNDSLLSAIAFYRRGSGLLLPNVDGDLAPLVTRLPVSHGEIYGGQIAYEYPVRPGLTARVFSRYTGSRDRDSGRVLPYLPQWQSGFRFDYVDRNGIRFLAGVSYIGRRRAEDFFGDPGRDLGGYMSTDLRVSWQQNLHLNWFIQVTDLFDRGPSFYSGYAGTGRTIFGGVEVRL